MGNKISVEEFINFGQTATLAYNLASHECEVDSSKQEILFDSLVGEKHIEGKLRMWDMGHGKVSVPGEFRDSSCPIKKHYE